MVSRELTWPSWRGSEELLAHVFRTAVKAASLSGSDSPACEVEIAVRGDCETFTSPQDFRDNVTREALAQFESIAATVRGPAVTVQLVMSLHGPRWSPWRSATVSLDVSGQDEDAVAAATERMRSAVERGTPGPWRHKLINELVDHGISFLMLLIVLVLLEIWDEPLFSWRGFFFLAPAIVASEYLRGVVYPHLEVRPSGTSSALVQLRRLLLGLVGSLTAGLVGTLLERLLLR